MEMIWKQAILRKEGREVYHDVLRIICLDENCEATEYSRETFGAIWNICFLVIYL